MKKKQKKKKSKNDVLKCGQVLEGNKFKTPMGVLSFPALFKPESFQEQDPRFKASIIWDNDETDLSLLKKVGKRCVKEKYGNKIPKKFNWPWRDGEEYEDTDGYGDGKTFITCSSKSKPLVIDRKKNPITDETEIYGGCQVRLILSPAVYEVLSKEKKVIRCGLSFYLQAVQKLKEGEPFGSRASAEDFGDDDLSGFEDEELDDDLDDDDDDIDDEDF